MGSWTMVVSHSASRTSLPGSAGNSAARGGHSAGLNAPECAGHPLGAYTGAALPTPKARGTPRCERDGQEPCRVSLPPDTSCIVASTPGSERDPPQSADVQLACADQATRMK